MPDGSLVIWNAPTQEIGFPKDVEVRDIVTYNKLLTGREMQQVAMTFGNKMYDMSAEYIWLRTISLLREKVLSLGKDFVAEMLGRTDNSSVDNLVEVDVINLAADLGFINKAGRLKLLQTNEIINYYTSREARDANEEMDKIDAERTIKACIQYVLSLDNDNYQFSYNNFRDSLRQTFIKEDDTIFNQLITSPYFYKRTTVRTFLNLLKTSKGAELETVFANLQTIVPKIWDELSSEDRWPIGFTYATSVNEGNKPIVSALKSLLLKVKGFDYVPENLRSLSFIESAKHLLDVHNGTNNFYNEPNAARNLSLMGNSIPVPAIGACVTATLACKIGNSYGISWDAQSYLDKILDNLTPDRWEYFLSQSLPVNVTVLYKLTYSDKRMRNCWYEIVDKYELYNLNIRNNHVKKIIEASRNKDGSSVNYHAQALYDNLR